MKTGFLGDLPAMDCALFEGKQERVRVAYFRNADGTVTLQPETETFGRRLQGAQTIAFDQYAVRPFSVKDPLVEARWALLKCGWLPATTSPAAKEG